jgi:hypothetical protein
LEPFPERYSHVANDILGLHFQEDPISDFNLNGLSAIQARGIDANRFAGKKPADRQRFKTSLAEPFLLTIDGNSVLGREIIKRSKGSNEIRIGEKPSRDPGSKKLVQGFSPLLHRDAQFGCDLCVMGCLAGLSHSTHNEMECLFNLTRFTHRLTSCSFIEKTGSHLHLSISKNGEKQNKIKFIYSELITPNSELV